MAKKTGTRKPRATFEQMKTRLENQITKLQLRKEIAEKREAMKKLK